MPGLPRAQDTERTRVFPDPRPVGQVQSGETCQGLARHAPQPSRRGRSFSQTRDRLRRFHLPSCPRRHRGAHGTALRVHLGDDHRPDSGPARAGLRQQHAHLAGVRRSRRPDRVAPRRPRDRPRRQGRHLPPQLQRIPGGAVRHLQGARRPHQRELPLQGGRTRLPARQRGRRSGLLPGLLRRAHLGDPAPAAEGQALRAGRRRHRGAAGRRGRLRALHPGPRPHGSDRALERRDLHALHRGHHGDAQGRDVHPWPVHLGHDGDRREHGGRRPVQRRRHPPRSSRPCARPTPSPSASRPVP